MMKRLVGITCVVAALFTQSAFASNGMANEQMQMTQAALNTAYKDMAKEMAGHSTNSMMMKRLRDFAGASTHQQADSFNFEMRVERDGHQLLGSVVPGVMVPSVERVTSPSLSMTTCSTPAQQEECRGAQYAFLEARPERIGDALVMTVVFELRNEVQGQSPVVMESLYWKGSVKVSDGKEVAINLDGKTVLHLKASSTPM